MRKNQGENRQKERRKKKAEKRYKEIRTIAGNEETRVSSHANGPMRLYFDTLVL